MKIHDFFPTNVLEHCPIWIDYLQIKSREKNTYDFGLGMIDCWDITKDGSQGCSHVMCDTSLLEDLLEVIETNPELPEEVLEKVIARFPFSLSDQQLGVEALREDMQLIYLLFICYKHLIWDVNSSSIDLFWRDKMRALSTQFSGNTHDASFHELCISCMQIFETSGSCVELEFSVTDGGRVKRTLSCYDTRDALWYALMMYIEVYQNGTVGYELALCKNCGREFMRANRRFELCEECREGKNRTKAYRQRKKEATHASEEHA